MGRKKKELISTPKPIVDKEYMEEVTWTCPKRGKVTEMVQVTRYKSKFAERKAMIGQDDSLDILNDNLYGNDGKEDTEE